MKRLEVKSLKQLPPTTQHEDYSNTATIKQKSHRATKRPGQGKRRGAKLGLLVSSRSRQSGKENQAILATRSQSFYVGYRGRLRGTPPQHQEDEFRRFPGGIENRNQVIRSTTAIKISGNGKILRTLPLNQYYNAISAFSEFKEFGNKFYVGSVEENFVGVLN